MTVTAAYEVTKAAKGQGHEYRIENQPVPRVTEILKTIISKGGGFDWWLRKDAIECFQKLIANNPDADWTTQDPKDIMRWSKPARTAADRGTAVHAAFENNDLDPQNHHPDDQGYIAAAALFAEVEKPEIEVHELIVGSREHRYAGTLDFRATMPDGSSVLGDLKTSKAAYAEYHFQLAAYEAAAIEMGYPPTDRQLIIILRPDGSYEVVVAQANVGDWLTALDWYRTLTDLKAAA